MRNFICLWISLILLIDLIDGFKAETKVSIDGKYAKVSAGRHVYS